MQCPNMCPWCMTQNSPNSLILFKQPHEMTYKQHSIVFLGPGIVAMPFRPPTELSACADPPSLPRHTFRSVGQLEVCLLSHAMWKAEVCHQTWHLSTADADHSCFALLSEIVLSLAGAAAFDYLVFLWNILASSTSLFREESSVGLSQNCT